MSYVLTFVGFAALIILHEAGHFAAAKAVGMRVERFSLFFGKMLVSFRRGETEYGIGWLPAGGYVKITGMNPHEELTPELRERAYFNQPPWKRIVVILAGPFVNLALAFVILFGVYLSVPQAVTRGGAEVTRGALVASTLKGSPAAGTLQPHDRIVTVDGRRIGLTSEISALVGRHRCADTQVANCIAATPAQITVLRRGQLVTLSIRPRYNASAKRMMLGFEIQPVSVVTYSLGPIDAAGRSVSEMWYVTHTTISRVARLFQAQDRRQLHGIVGGVVQTQQAFSYSTSEAFGILALISLSLAVVNLFPFLPLDGGHVFWAVAEKLRGRRISFDVMERAGVVGFVLIIMIFVIGLSNDISTLSSGGFRVH